METILVLHDKDISKSVMEFWWYSEKITELETISVSLAKDFPIKLSDNAMTKVDKLFGNYNKWLKTKPENNSLAKDLFKVNQKLDKCLQSDFSIKQIKEVLDKPISHIQPDGSKIELKVETNPVWVQENLK